jgi:hypothetical protein
MARSVVLVSEPNLRDKISIILLVFVAFLVGCTSTPSPTPTPVDVNIVATATSAFVVVTTEGERVELPASWTPTDTPTLVPPTLTPSITPTFTPSPTFTVDEMCTRFTVVNTPRSGRPYLTGAIVPFMFYAEFPDAMIRIFIVNTETGEELEGAYPSAAAIGAQFPMDVVGTYEWTIGLVTQIYGEICQEAGTFSVIAAPEQSGNVTPTATAAPTEAESTQEALAICDSFTVQPDFVEGQVFSTSENVNVTLHIDVPEVFIRFVVTLRETGQRQTVQVPGGTPFTVSLPTRLLYGAGVYDWTATIYNEQIGQQCERNGSFAVAEAGATATFPPVTATTPAPVETTPSAVPSMSSLDLTSTAVATFFPDNIATAMPTLDPCAVTPRSTITATVTATATTTACPTLTSTPRPSATRRPMSTTRTPTPRPTATVTP